MASLFSAFVMPSRARDAWFFAGPTSSFPDIEESGSAVLADQLPCKQASAGGTMRGCRIFHVPREDSSKAAEVTLKDAETWEDEGKGLQDQVLVFQYKGKFHAVDHKCPHQSYPLSNGTPFDIEDFGIILSAGLHCPKHGWSFDLFSGNGDRGNYRLKVWEVQLRPVGGSATVGKEGAEDRGDVAEVWVRRKQRMG